MKCHNMSLRGFCAKNTTGATRGAGTAYPSGAPEFTPGFKWGACCSIFSFMCMSCRSLFVLLSFLFWLLCCLFFDLQVLITPLVSSNSSCLYLIFVVAFLSCIVLLRTVVIYIIVGFTSIVMHVMCNQ